MNSQVSDRGIGEKCPLCGTALEFGQMPFGMRVATRRKRIGLTQHQLAEKVGLDRATIANIETGRHKVSFDLIRPLATALQLTVEEMIP
jgi:transcriptional regulator with XRE-family HTH domain